MESSLRDLSEVWGCVLPECISEGVREKWFDEEESYNERLKWVLQDIGPLMVDLVQRLKGAFGVSGGGNFYDIHKQRTLWRRRLRHACHSGVALVRKSRIMKVFVLILKGISLYWGIVRFCVCGGGERGGRRWLAWSSEEILMK